MAPIKSRVELTLCPPEEGGLVRQLQTPTPSLVFRYRVGDALGDGLVAVVYTPGGGRLTAGEVVDVEVIFPDPPPGGVRPGQRFALWNGRVVGNARIVSVEREDFDLGS